MIAFSAHAFSSRVLVIKFQISYEFSHLLAKGNAAEKPHQYWGYKASAVQKRRVRRKMFVKIIEENWKVSDFLGLRLSSANGRLLVDFYFLA